MNESICTFLPEPEATSENSPTPDGRHGLNTVEDIGSASGNTITPTKPALGDIASALTGLNKIINWATEYSYKVAGWVTVSFPAARPTTATNTLLTSNSNRALRISTVWSLPGLTSDESNIQAL
jgi:hypothetical protein